MVPLAMQFLLMHLSSDLETDRNQNYFDLARAFCHRVCLIRALVVTRSLEVTMRVTRVVISMQRFPLAWDFSGSKDSLGELINSCP